MSSRVYMEDDLDYLRLTKEDYRIAKANGIDVRLAYLRFHRGWDKERAITEDPALNRPDPESEYIKWKRIAKTKGIKGTTFHYRVKVKGMSPEEAANQPVTIITTEPERMYWINVAAGNKIKRKTFHARMRSGMSMEEAATKPLQERGKYPR